MNSSIFQYTGKVTVKIGNTVRKYRNNGEPRLFQLFAQLLADPDSITDVNTPQQVELRGKNTDDYELEDALYYPIYSIYKQVVSTDGGGYGVKISFTLLPTNIQHSNYFDYILVLQDGDQKDLASISIEDEIIFQVANGRQALVEWILEISNTSEEKE